MEIGRDIFHTGRENTFAVNSAPEVIQAARGPQEFSGAKFVETNSDLRRTDR